jgi:hypothetical protein
MEREDSQDRNTPSSTEENMVFMDVIAQGF